MKREMPIPLMSLPSTRKLGLALVLLGGLAAGCGPRPQATEPEVGATSVPEMAATPTPSGTGVQAVRQDSLDFCFSYPQGYTLMPFGESVEVVGPQSESAPEPGLMWIDVSDAQGRTAEDVANEELSYVGGLNPPRYSVLLGGEEAVVLDGMPGQNLVRRVYIVHDGKLIIPTFSPYDSDNAFANEQMEALYAAVTSSWVWISSGAPCPPGS